MHPQDIPPRPAPGAARFLSPLQAEEVEEDRSADRRGTWKLLIALMYQSAIIEDPIEVPAGFITDFASVPRIPLAFWLTGGTGHKAAVVHDWLYTTHQVERDQADAIFKEALLASGVPAWRAWLMHAGVRVGGGGAWDTPGQAQTEHIEDQIKAVADPFY